jgi:Uncharacterized conserved protein
MNQYGGKIMTIPSKMEETVLENVYQANPCQKQRLTVQNVIDKILDDMCGGSKFEQTCDIIPVGNPDNDVTGIVTSFMATYDVIQEAVRLGANFIITHEPTWFTGNDATDWCAQDSVYLAKRKYLEDHDLTVWRLHDHMHLGSDTDYIYEGLLTELGWHQYLLPDEKYPWIYELPETTVGKLAEFFKAKLHMQTIQIIGAPQMKVKRLGILVGGGSLGFGAEAMPMQVMERNRLDLLIVGDITEWTICAYINDAYQMGFNKAMLTLGHERSEEAGMKYLAPWLQERFPDIPVSFVDAKEPFKYL